MRHVRRCAPARRRTCVASLADDSVDDSPSASKLRALASSVTVSGLKGCKRSQFAMQKDTASE